MSDTNYPAVQMGRRKSAGMTLVNLRVRWMQNQAGHTSDNKADV